MTIQEDMTPGKLKGEDIFAYVKRMNPSLAPDEVDQRFTQLCCAIAEQEGRPAAKSYFPERNISPST